MDQPKRIAVIAAILFAGLAAAGALDYALRGYEWRALLGLAIAWAVRAGLRRVPARRMTSA